MIKETDSENITSKSFTETLHCFSETIEAMNDLKTEFILLESIKQFAIDFVKADDNYNKYFHQATQIQKYTDIRNQAKENLRQLLEIE